MTAPNFPHKALRTISVNGVTAFGIGDLIPEEHITTLGLLAGEDYEANPVFDNALAAPVGGSDDLGLEQLAPDGTPLPPAKK